MLAIFRGKGVRTGDGRSQLLGGLGDAAMANLI
jgi:hypothetical protein